MVQNYEPPMDLNTIEKKYGKGLYEKLKDDPVHSFRATTGIELIHREPTLKELLRIMNNWICMSEQYKTLSDEKSMELFGMTNSEHFKKLIASYF